MNFVIVKECDPAKVKCKSKDTAHRKGIGSRIAVLTERTIL